MRDLRIRVIWNVECVFPVFHVTWLTHTRDLKSEPVLLSEVTPVTYAYAWFEIPAGDTVPCAGCDLRIRVIWNMLTSLRVAPLPWLTHTRDLKYAHFVARGSAPVTYAYAWFKMKGFGQEVSPCCDLRIRVIWNGMRGPGLVRITYAYA